MSTTESKTLPTEPVRYRDWNTVVAANSNPMDYSAEPLHMFPDCLHDSIIQLQRQRQMSLYADIIMKHLSLGEKNQTHK